MQQRPCGGCWAARRLLVAPAPAVAATGDHSMDAQQAHLERVLTVTTAMLILASVSYLALSTLHACIRAARRHQPGPGGDDGGDDHGPAPPREATKRALDGIPVRVVAIPRDAPAGGRKEEDGDKDCAVCLAEYAAGDEVRVLPACRHGFHRECVDRWLLTRAPTFPVCRAPVAVHLDGADAKEEVCPSPTGHGGHLDDFRRLVPWIPGADMTDHLLLD